MKEVKSPYMIQLYGVSLRPLSMIMEYCSRGSLYHVLNDKTLDIGWERGLGFALNMAQGINVLHTWKIPIVHRDLKSLNLLVCALLISLPVLHTQMHINTSHYTIHW
jgi:serine/threonine protein kinase